LLRLALDLAAAWRLKIPLLTGGARTSNSYPELAGNARSIGSVPWLQDFLANGRDLVKALSWVLFVLFLVSSFVANATDLSNTVVMIGASQACDEKDQVLSVANAESYEAADALLASYAKQKNSVGEPVCRAIYNQRVLLGERVLYRLAPWNNGGLRVFEVYPFCFMADDDTPATRKDGTRACAFLIGVTSPESAG
jgi:hypothetical protein